MVKLILVRVGAWHVPILDSRQGPETRNAINIRQDPACKTYVPLSWQTYFSIKDTTPSTKQQHHHLPFGMQTYLPLHYPRMLSNLWIWANSLKTLGSFLWWKKCVESKAKSTFAESGSLSWHSPRHLRARIWDSWTYDMRSWGFCWFEACKHF